jgi:hypothetical protein
MAGEAVITDGDISLGLARPNNYVPYTPTLPTSPAVLQWQVEQSNYRRYWEWFYGTALNEEDPEASREQQEPAYLWPLHINPIKWTCMKHAAALFGEVPDDYDSMVRISFRDDDNHTTARAKKHAQRINRVWFDSHGKEAMATAGVMGQFMKGSFFKVKYDPLDKSLRYKTKVELLTPDFVLPIYNSANFWDLVECYVMYYIGSQEAESRFGIKVPQQTSAGKILYCEHWNKTRYEITVGGLVPTFDIGNYSVEEGGRNPFGFVPFVYIPHPERVGNFYGMSHVDDLEGLTCELNSRMADVGDYVSANSESLYWIRNVTKKLETKRFAKRHLAIDLGSKNALSQASDPEIGRLDTPTGTAVHKEYIDQLIKMIDRTGHLSPVAYGEDEGSQRSGTTLAARMWTTTAHIKRERVLFTTGMQRLDWMIGEIMRVKGIDGVTQEDVWLKNTIGYFPALPMDRKELVDEVAVRRGTHTISTRQAVETLSDGSIDTDAHLAEIKQDIAEETKNQTEIMQAKGFQNAKPDTKPGSKPD